MGRKKKYTKEYFDKLYLNAIINNQYELTEYIGHGNISVVYKAYFKEIDLTLACKVIPQKKLKKGWELELQKMAKLSVHPNVVHYVGHGTFSDNLNKTTNYVLMDFIDGWNLKEYLLIHNNQLLVPFIEFIVETIIHVLFACEQTGIEHGDLHEGNILISKKDSRLVNDKEKIWVTDFGYGGSYKRRGHDCDNNA